MSLVSFVKYNNALPIAISFLLLSFAGAFAASPEVRDTIYSEENSVVSIDNTYIANKDLSTYTPRVQITGVTEDEEQYYVHYSFTSIALKDAVWQDTTEDKIMQVSKNAIVGQDLGLYVTEQLKQNIDHELARLREVQDIERRQVSQKVVATEYSGLIGKLLDDTTEALPGYTPVVVPESAPQNAAVGETSNSQTTVASNSSGDRTPPTIQILGNNPAQLLKGSTYIDLGAVVTDNVNHNLGYKTYLDGTLVQEVQISTAAPREYVIRYETEDQAGNTAMAERKVIVTDPSAPANSAEATAEESAVASSTEQ